MDGVQTLSGGNVTRITYTSTREVGRRSRVERCFEAGDANNVAQLAF